MYAPNQYNTKIFTPIGTRNIMIASGKRIISDIKRSRELSSSKKPTYASIIVHGIPRTTIPKPAKSPPVNIIKRPYITKTPTSVSPTFDCGNFIDFIITI